LGSDITADAFGRGDLVFWKGHVAIGLGDGLIIHANGHHMAVAVEPLAEAIRRIGDTGSQPTSYRRL
jgi:cell wall-associated NlpC family hydrolase